MALQARVKRAIQKGVDNKENFHIGNVSGKWFDPLDLPHLGKLSTEPYGRDLQMLNKDKSVYVIYSYKTPIPWWDGEKWTIPNVKYSVSTTNHQNVVRVAIANPGFYSDVKW